MQPEDEIQRRRRVTELMAQSIKPPRVQSTPVHPPALSQLSKEINNDNAAYDARAKAAGAMSYNEWIDAQRTGKIPPHVTHLQNALKPTPPAQPSPRVSVSSQPGATITGNLNLPQPSPSINIPNDAPAPNAPVEQPQQPRGIFGPSLAGLGKLDRDIALRNTTASADPESDVRVRGDQVDVTPPRMAGVNQKGRFRSGLEAGLAAFGNADPDRPLYSLGQGLGGLVTGVASPRAGAKITRKFEQQRLDDDVSRGLKLEQEQAQLDQIRGPKMGQMSTRVVGEGEYPGIEAGTEIRVRIDPRTGSITDVVGPNEKPVISDLAKRPAAGAPHYEKDADGYLLTIQGGRAQRVTDASGQPVQVKRGQGDEEYVEVEVNGRKLRVSPGQALSYYGQVGERETKRDEVRAEREAKYGAAKSEYDSLVEAEKGAGEEKNRAYQVLDEMRKSNQPKEDIAQAEQDAQKANDYYRSFGEKKKDAARRMQENKVREAGAQSYAGRTMSRANLERYAKDNGLSVEDAQKQVEAQGVRVQ
jgi:hypothetical protein